MKHRSNYTRSHQPIHGFTLVELLVVISIIALLLSILMPSLGRARAMARRVMCGTRLKSIHLAAVLYSNDDSKSRLPRGGIHRNNLDYDDGVGMTIDNYFKMSNYVTSIDGLPTSLEEINDMQTKNLAEMAQKCSKDGSGQIFLCPSYQQGNKIEYYDRLFREKRTFKEGVIFTSSSPNFYARLGFCYLAGFTTDQWDFDSLPGATTGRSKSWDSPQRASDKGLSVLASDRVRYSPGFNITNVSLPHSGSGYEVYSAPRDLASFKFESLNGGTNVLTLDGAVEFRRFSETKARQMYYNSRNGDFTPNFTFF